MEDAADVEDAEAEIVSPDPFFEDDVVVEKEAEDVEAEIESPDLSRCFFEDDDVVEEAEEDLCLLMGPG